MGRTPITAHQLGMRILLEGIKTVRTYETIAHTYNTTLQGFCVLHVLAHLPQSNIATITSFLEARQPSVSKSIKLLTQNGLVSSTKSGNSVRSVYALTPSGRKAYKSVRLHIESHIAALMHTEGFSRSGLDFYLDSLEKARQAAERFRPKKRSIDTSSIQSVFVRKRS